MAGLLSIHWLLAASIWYFANGVLHDIFVLANHKGPYNRDLLRLLMDGHVLVLSGLIVFVGYMVLLKQAQPGVALICAIAGLFMVIYCGMIFPFLKSFVTLFISIALVAVAGRLVFSPAVTGSLQ